MNLSPTQKYALDLANKHNGLKRLNKTIYWIGADIDQSKSEKRGKDPYPKEEWVGTHSVNSLIRAGLLRMEGDTAKVVECPWCSNKEYNHIECSLINKEGHPLVKGVADYCPKCGRRLE
jgi:hypothetical protein